MTVACEIRNWAGNHSYLAGRVDVPRSEDDVRQSVRSAERVRALGSRHSFNHICDTEGVLVDTRGLASVPTVDIEGNRVTVTAGTTYGAVARALSSSEWALPNLGSLPHISVVGAMSTGTHGSGSRNQVLAASVSSLRMVLADGDVVTVRRGDDSFAGCVVALGGLGIVVSVDLDLVPAFAVVQTLHDLGDWSSVMGDVPDLLSDAYSVSVFTRWGAGDTELLLKRTRGERTAVAVAYPEKTLSTLLVDGPNLTARGHEVPWSAGLPHFRLEHEPSFGDEVQSEFFLPAQRTVEALRAVSALGEDLDPHLIVSEIRSVAPDDLWLSPAYGRHTTCVHFTWKPHPEAVDELNSRVAEVLQPMGARPHWGKRFPSDWDLAGLYPRLDDFLGLRQDTDPGRKFSNSFLDDVLRAPRYTAASPRA